METKLFDPSIWAIEKTKRRKRLKTRVNNPRVPLEQIAQILSTQMIRNPNFLLGYYFQILDLFNYSMTLLLISQVVESPWFPSCGYFSQSPRAQHLKGVNFVKSFQSMFLKGEENGKDSTIWMSVTLNVCQGSTILMSSAHNISIKVLINRANEKQHSKVKYWVEDARNFALSKIRQEGSHKVLSWNVFLWVFKNTETLQTASYGR